MKQTKHISPWQAMKALLKEKWITAYRLWITMWIHPNTMYAYTNDKKKVWPGMARRLTEHLGGTDKWRLKLQAMYNLSLMD